MSTILFKLENCTCGIWSLLYGWDVLHSFNELNLRSLELQLRHHTSLLYLVNHGHLALQRNGHVHNRVRELLLLNLHGLLDRPHGRLDLHHDRHVDNTHQ